MIRLNLKSVESIIMKHQNLRTFKNQKRAQQFRKILSKKLK